MRSVLSFATGLLGTLALCAPLAAQEVTLRVHHFLPPQAPIAANFIRPWAEKVTRESGGRIRFEIVPDMQLGGSAGAIADQVKEGLVDVGWVQLGATPGRFPGAEAFELPFMPVAAEPTSRAFQEFFDKHLRNEFAEFKVIAVHVHGRGLLHAKEKDVLKLEDVAGLRLSAPTRMIGRLLASLGAIPVGMPEPALPAALRGSIVDGAAVTWEATLRLKVAELVKSHTDFSGANGLYTSTFAFLMNKQKYDALPADLKAVIDANSGAAAAGWAGRVMDEGDVPGPARAQALANPIHALDEEETARWRARAAAIEQAWIAEMKGKGLDGDTLVGDARALIQKHTQR